MRRLLLLALCVSGALTLTACPSKPKSGECKTSQDCAAQAGYGKVCVDGLCQECGQDSDCQAGFVCQANKCAPAPAPAPKAEAPAPAPEPAAPAAPSMSAECADAARFTIRFGFDEATLTSDSQSSLQTLADCLKSAPAKRVVVQGNADERGTSQYNVALGSRRADAARKYLSDLGVSGAIDTVSFGKERPVCRQSSEDCWAKNRRDDFVIDR